MAIPRILVCAALATAFSATLVAQMSTPTPTGYHSISCIKVVPGKGADFSKFMTEDLHKYAQSRVDSGAISAWLLLRTVMPQGSEAECDYVQVAFYPGLPNEPLSDAAVTAALHQAGLQWSAQEYYDRRSALSTLVWNNITQYQVLVGGAHKGDYLVFNSMKVADVGEWVAYEKKVWQPIAEAMVKEGVRTAWAVNVQVFPMGSKDKTLASTVDVYPTWASMFTDPGFDARFKKVHPDMEFGTTFEHIQKLRTIESTVLYHVEDAVSK
jgi:hypothetical protein